MTGLFAYLKIVQNTSRKGFRTIIVHAISNANSRNNNVSKPNIHISLSFHKDDILDNETIYKIAEDYLKDLGYSNQPYAVYRHFDKEHPHIHLVSSQLDHLGKKINDSHIKRRSYKITRQLEEKYQITKAVDKNEIFDKKDLSKANYGFINIQNTLLNNKVEKEKLLRNMMGRVYFVINPILKNAELSLKPEKLSGLITQLKRKGIELEVKRTQTGENPNTIYGLLFQDIREGHIYTASDLRIKTKDFLGTIDDDMKNLSSKGISDLLSEKNEEKNAISFPKNEEHTYENHLNVFDNLLSIFSSSILPIRNQNY